MKRQRIRRHGFSYVEVCLIFAVTVVLITALMPASAQFWLFGRSRENQRRSACQNNLKLVALGIKQYVQDYDELFPLVTGGTAEHNYGWADVTQPYVKSLQVLQCPSEKHEAGTDPRQPGYTDYWYNRNLSRVNESMLDYIANTFLLGDGDGGHQSSNARYAINKLPRGWLSTPGSPALRHLDGANYAFADGHVKWMVPQRVTTTKPSATAYTFRVH